MKKDLFYVNACFHVKRLRQHNMPVRLQAEHTVSKTVTKHVSLSFLSDNTVVIFTSNPHNNMKTINYPTTGTCSKLINVTVDDNGVINNVEFIGGCHGNQQGISSLVRGMKTEDVIKRLEGIRCGYKSTSCPDQLAQALRKITEE